MIETDSGLEGPGAEVTRARGAALAEAEAAVILIHGRGATAESILELTPHLGQGSVAFLAPQASGNTWYPTSFLAPRNRNEPALSRSLERIAATVGRILATGLPAERLILAGFSQGACLAIEFALREPRRYGAVIALTGGFIGPPGTEPAPSGSFAGTPVLLAAGDPDPHVPWWRVEETAEVFRHHGAEVDLRRYPGRPHTVSLDELEAARGLIESSLIRPFNEDLRKG